jgi:uncharacterized protein YeeX (DUF496 family)
VASDEILKRIDDHMARGNELMAEIRHEHQLNRAAFAETAQLLGRMVDVLAQMERRLDDQGDAIRANTKAVLRLLDRFGNGGGDPATA